MGMGGISPSAQPAGRGAGGGRRRGAREAPRHRMTWASGAAGARGRGGGKIEKEGGGKKGEAGEHGQAAPGEEAPGEERLQALTREQSQAEGADEDGDEHEARFHRYAERGAQKDAGPKGPANGER